MNTQLLNEWLSEFQGVADGWFKKRTFVKERYDFFAHFFSKIRNNEFHDESIFFVEFDTLCDNINSLNTNKLALSRAKAQRERRSSMGDYVTKFKYLIDIFVDVDKRFEAALGKGKYGLNYFGDSSISELIAHNEPEKYTFLNQREKQAIRFLDIKIKEKKIGKYYAEFNDFVKENIVNDYCFHIYPTQNISDLSTNSELLLSNTTLMLEIDQFFSWVFETKNIGKIDSCFIDEIKIQNFYSIQKPIELLGLKDKKFIFLLGENGCGKTILLKALLITLKKFYIDTEASKETTGVIDDILKQNKEFFLTAIGYQDVNKEDTEEFKSASPVYLKNLYAYGTNRNKISETAKGERYGFLTLFKEDEYLINTEGWLQKMRFAELEKKNEYIKIKDIEKILSDLLDTENMRLSVSSEKVSFWVNNIEFTLKQLSEGYRSVIIFIIDLLARLVENNPKVIDSKKFKAIVLIDELDLYLHPTWQKTICKKLASCFPNIQFFITTHSPILVLGSPKEKTIIFRLTNESNQTEVAYTYTGTEIETWLPNVLISSPLFSTDYLDDVSQTLIQKLRTEDNFNDWLQNNQNIAKLKEKESEIERLYLEKINGKNSHDFS